MHIPDQSSVARPAAVVEPPIAAAGFLAFQNANLLDPTFEHARRLNARVPIERGLVATAEPFVISGSALDRARATDCLAAAAYYEAGDNERGQRAVAQVVLNRLRHPAYPSTVCAVVFDGSERRTGCQFTFTCDGAMLRHRPSQRAWQQARRIATEALHGYAEPAIGYATHYHTDWVYPRWSPTLTKIAAVDTHLFFQASHNGIRNFRSPYAGSEPRIAAIASLSPAHAGGILVPSDVTPDAAPPPPVSTDDHVSGLAALKTERLPDRAQDPGPGTFLVVLDAGTGPEIHLRDALEKCGARSLCKFIGWTDPSRRAAQLPMPGSAVDAIAFSYTRSGSADTGTARWNCREFPQSDRSLCLRRGG